MSLPELKRNTLQAIFKTRLNMRGVNIVILTGLVGAEPETSDLGEGKYATKIPIATSRTLKGQSVTDWHRVVFFGKLAEIAKTYIHKGTLVSVTGELQYRKYKNKDNQDVTQTEIIGHDLQLLSSPQRKEAGQTSQASQDSAPAPEAVPNDPFSNGGTYSNTEDGLGF